MQRENATKNMKGVSRGPTSAAEPDDCNHFIHFILIELFVYEN